MNELTEQLRNPRGEKGKEVATNMDKNNRSMTLHAIDHLSLENGDRILEIGHGNANHLAKLLAKRENLHYTGLDISHLMTEEALRINCTFVDQKQARFQTYPGEHIPYSDAIFDAVFSVNTLYFWENPKFFFQEIARIMKPSARFALTFADKQFMQSLSYVQSPTFTLYTCEEVEQLSVGSSLYLQKIESTTENIYNKIGEKVVRKFYTMIFTK